ncbi:MAG: helix-turn-helix domain-containing protein [Spirochaetaceae bacterium]|jgi:cytoskeletal protein RodZ|nr:helix-turn-helix domain-containing protein [Spirochaetaceae bacterium]
MKNLGEQLRIGRENKGLSLNDVSREINIAQKYLVALETEDFSQFPAETYLQGFLKNYCEYLGLDVKEILSLYRLCRIEEQPVPIEQLLHKPVNVQRIVVTSLIAVAVLALGAGAVYYFRFMPKKEQPAEYVERVPAEYPLTEGVLEKRFFVGDKLIVPLDGNDYRVTVSGIGDAITLAAPGKNITIDLNSNAAADINDDGFAELHISAIDYVQNRPETGALMRFDIMSTALAAEQPPAGTEAGNIPVANPGAATQVIFNNASPYPFTLRVVFNGYCMFRWEILREANRQNRTERYFLKGEEQTITAQNGVRVWISNASAVKMWVIGGGNNVPLEAGSAGEIVVEDIYWIRDDDGRYKLIQARLET